MKYDVIVIGAGLTGLSAAFFMRQRGFSMQVLEKNSRTGGAICSHNDSGFVYEEGPNTGVIGNAETAELFEGLGLQPEIAKREAERRLILKNGQWYPLPAGPVGFLRTPLFACSDKIKILFEPFRPKGTNPDESVAALASRRIGQSFVDYAVNPFISGIYAGDPGKLVTRYALPKLYNLEQQYGSFIGGAIRKGFERKDPREKKATQKVFSCFGGLGTLIQALEKKVGATQITCGAKNLYVAKSGDEYEACYVLDGKLCKIQSRIVISTVGAYALPEIVPFIDKNLLRAISELNYAKVIQIAVGVKREAINDRYISFGGLIPQKENRQILGVLFPSFCFEKRAPEGYATLAVYMGGTRHPEYIDMDDNRIKQIVAEELQQLFQIPASDISFMRIFRHEHAIPQYELSSGVRFATIRKIEQENKGLIIAGNASGGIGIADRIKQAYYTAERAWMVF